MASELKKKAVKSVAWVSIGQVARQLMSLVVTGVLARLLMPEAFGLVGMAAVFLAVMETFQELGLSSAVIQRQDVTEEQLSTVFSITIICGIAIAAVVAVASPLIAAFYHKPELAPITRLMGLSFFITSFLHIPQALLKKALHFRTLVLIQIGVGLGSSAVSVILAFLGLGVYALVWGNLVNDLLLVAAVWAAVGWRPTVMPRLASAWKLIAFGGNFTGAGVCYYIRSSADSLLIGRFVGATALGIYGMAYRIMLLPMRRVTWSLSQIAFPIFSVVQDDKDRVARGYLQMAHIVALVTFPAMAGLVIVAPEAVRVVLGEKWMRAAFLIQVLALIGALQAVSAPVSNVLRSQGRPDLQFGYEAFAAVVAVVGFLVGLRWDVEGIAVSYSVTQVLVTPILLHLGFRLVGLSFRAFFAALRGPAFATLAMALSVLLYREYGLKVAGLGPLWLLGSEMVIGVTVYALVLLLIAPGTYTDLISLVNVLIGKTKSEAVPAA